MKGITKSCLTKEGNLLKGTEINVLHVPNSRVSNSKLSDPLFEIVINTVNNAEFNQMLIKVMTELGYGEVFSSFIQDDGLIITPTPDWPIEILDITLTLCSKVGGLKVSIKGTEYKFNLDLSPSKK